MRAETSVAPALSAVAPARRWARERLVEAGVEPARLEVLVLLVSELVTNAVAHADPPVTLRVDVDDVRTRVEVTDGAREDPVLRNPPPSALGGRGVMFVDRLSSSWGTTPEEGGVAVKAVWFELRHDDVPADLARFAPQA
ncbi:ATP-binding protein [Cellulomonas sp. H30R-01]|uniref:ATP-binding protein n=1 Tax=Cellulomonas algicola TaxID=2071633 RepID=A0A401UZV1_9CELL|nr:MULTISPECIES: ATP-binding protein [Cellulomonas]QHT57353.1 ATP-binding protein [Cellulomonas sp. H30R-01]GCD20134.1 ATP-binding protein [Cellulomonas algicola]